MRRYEMPRRRISRPPPKGLQRTKPRDFLEWKTLLRWGALPAWEEEPPGYLLRLAREEADLTQNEMGQRLRCSQQAIARAERWESNPTVRFLRVWARALGQEVRIRLLAPIALAAACLLAAPVCLEAQGGHITVAFAAEPTQLDPTISSAGVDFYFLGLFYEQLLALDRDVERVPWLAESWEIREQDGRTTIFVKLREGVKFHNGDELTAHVAAFKTGAVDWIDAVPPAQVEEFEAMDGVEVVSLPGANNLFLMMNAIDPQSPFKDERVRQAVAYAFDVEAIIEHVLYGQGIRTAQLAPGELGYDPEFEPYPFNAARARQLLSVAG